MQNKNLSGTVANVIGFVGSIASIISLFSGNPIYKYIGISFVIVYFISLTLFIGWKYFSVNKIKKNIHLKYTYLLGQLSEKNRHIFNYIKNDIIYILDRTPDIRVFENIVQRCCTAINDYFDCYLGKKTSVCIKIIKTENLLNDDIDKWEISTLARSESTLQARSDTDNHPAKIKDNTDFETIVSEGLDVFSTPNIPSMIEKWNANGRGYKNSRQDFLKFYKSTIVVPIRIDVSKISLPLRSYVNETHLKSRKYHVLGFLCIDSMHTFENEIESFLNATEQAKAFSDLLYPLLETFLVSQIHVEE